MNYVVVILLAILENLVVGEYFARKVENTGINAKTKVQRQPSSRHYYRRNCQFVVRLQPVVLALKVLCCLQKEVSPDCSTLIEFQTGDCSIIRHA